MKLELNKIYCMDNLELLKQMEDESIDLIYCDILYGTGRDFGDYKDLKPIKEEIVNFYESRLHEFKRVLKPTGSIYLHMDSKINHWLRIIMDDVFGCDNFKNEIIWNRCNSNRTIVSKFPDNTDKILFYSKNKNKNTFNVQYNIEACNPYYMSLRHSGSDSNKEDRPNLHYPFYYDKDTGKLYLEEKEGCINIYPINTQGKEKRWRWSKNKSKNNLESLFVREVNGRLDIYTKSKEYKKINISNIWDDNTLLNPIYATQKPKSILERIIKASSNEGDIVADFFCGSGTSLVVAKELGRQYIGCDINPKAVEISNERCYN